MKAESLGWGKIKIKEKERGHIQDSPKGRETQVFFHFPLSCRHDFCHLVEFCRVVRPSLFNTFITVPTSNVCVRVCVFVFPLICLMSVACFHASTVAMANVAVQ